MTPGTSRPSETGGEGAAPAGGAPRIRKVGSRRATSTPAETVELVIGEALDGDGERSAPDASRFDERDRWLLGERPPHWG